MTRVQYAIDVLLSSRYLTPFSLPIITLATRHCIVQQALLNTEVLLALPAKHTLLIFRKTRWVPLVSQKLIHLVVHFHYLVGVYIPLCSVPMLARLTPSSWVTELGQQLANTPNFQLDLWLHTYTLNLTEQLQCTVLLVKCLIYAKYIHDTLQATLCETGDHACNPQQLLSIIVTTYQYISTPTSGTWMHQRSQLTIESIKC